MTFQVDPGATTNVVPLRVVRGIELLPTDTTLEMWNGATAQPVGKCRLNIRNPKNQKKYNIELLVVDNNSTPLLGRKAAECMKLITVNYDNPAQIHATRPPKVEPAANILSEYPAEFDGSLGTLPGTVHFHVDESVQPVVNRPRRIPVTLEKVVAKELDNLVEQGVITPVDEPSEWVN